MTMHHYDPSELDRADPELDRLAERLESYAASVEDAPPIGFSDRVMAALDDEPAPVGGGWWNRFVGLLATAVPVARAGAAAAIVLVAVVGILTFGSMIRDGRDFGSTPPPASVGPLPSPTSLPSPSQPTSPSPSSSPSPSPTVRVTPSPTASDDDEFGTPEPDETPELDDNSGPGGGGDDSGGDDSSGSGSGSDSSGPGSDDDRSGSDD
jgi:uncharacterized membrane protein YgcG